MEFVIRPYHHGEEEYVADIHRRLYTKEYSWGPSFTYYAAKIALDFANKPKNDREELLIAEVEGRPVGCTELPLIFNDVDLPIPYIDVMKVHIETLINTILEE